MHVTFKDEQIDTARIEKNAVSVYYDYSETGELQGRNEVRGHTITLIWDGEGLQQARVTGGAVGHYYPHAE